MRAGTSTENNQALGMLSQGLSSNCRMVMVIEPRLRDDPVEIAIPLCISGQYGQVVLVLGSVLKVGRAAVSLKTEDRLDASLDACLLVLEV